jgi:hypothetical protein
MKIENNIDFEGLNNNTITGPETIVDDDEDSEYYGDSEYCEDSEYYEDSEDVDDEVNHN